MKFHVYVTSSKPISKVYLIDPSHYTACLHVYHSLVARERLGNNVTAESNTFKNRRIVGRVVFYEVYAVWKKKRKIKGDYLFPEIFDNSLAHIDSVRDLRYVESLTFWNL
jgi:hypothetical protein